MKDYVRKFATLLLVLSLLICTIALPVLATEVEECSYIGNGYHCVISYRAYICADCGYSYDTTIGDRYYEPCTVVNGTCKYCGINFEG